MPQNTPAGSRKKNVALILGSGFSAEAGLPTTAKVVEQFLNPPVHPHTPLSGESEQIITQALLAFWKDVFGYVDGGTKPSLEEHFTQLDLAANSGHHLGSRYSPKKLRALRRFSIHRVFHILDSLYTPSPAITKLLKKLCSEFSMTIITLNWDVVVEKHCSACGILWDYMLKERPKDSVPILKMHGSANWTYCDSCRRVAFDPDEKLALHSRAYIEETDLKLFAPAHVTTVPRVDTPNRECKCGNTVGGRLATFSYRKDLSIFQFQRNWERAFVRLRQADAWFFSGYSLPEADFEFKHLLKSAQLARRTPADLLIEATCGSRDDVRERFEGFFGRALPAGRLHRTRLAPWVDGPMSEFVRGVRRPVHSP